MKLTDISVVKNIMEEHGISFQKKFGQNFLVNESVPQRIARDCGAGTEDGIIEIGPGIGTLTCELARLYKKVVAIEIDTSLIPVLADTLAEFDNVTVINTDIMKVDIDELLKTHFNGMNVTVCANLPYYITTPIIMKLLESGADIDNITVMIQKEVAQRLTSKAGEAEYGAVTASVAYYADTQKLINVSSGCFMPKPKVDSAVVRMVVYKDKPIKAESDEMLFKVIKGAFSMRRKTLMNNLANTFTQIEKNKLENILSELGFDLKIRGECLSISDFAKLSDKILQLNNNI